MKNLLLIICSFFALNTNAQIINTIAGIGTYTYSGDGGQATAAGMYTHGIAFDAVGNLYIVDAARIRKVTTSGMITTIAGNGTSGYSGDGGQATSAEIAPYMGLTFDAMGNLYLADYSNSVIRKINTLGIITTIAGNGTQGYTGDGAQATDAELNLPPHITLDAVGNLYIADEYNNVIRKVNTAGIISTIAGNGAGAGSGGASGGYSGDGGQATAAGLYLPTGITLDVAGNLYIADFSNSCIRKVNTAGIISTIAGNGTAAYSGDGGQATSAELWAPTGVVFDAAGNLYIADEYNKRIRKVNTSGIITTFAGNGTAAYSGDGGLATAAELNYPTGAALDAAGNLYIVDQNNNRIRMVSKALTTVTVNSATICAGATTTLIANGANTYTWNTSATSASITPSPINTTTYTVYGVTTFTAFNVSNASMGTATTIVTVNPLPTVTATSNTISLCADSTATLQANGAVTYTWSTSAITPTIAITPTVTTTYTVTGTGTNTCIDMTTVTQTVTNCSTASIKQFISNNELTIYPNPSTGSISIANTSNIDELKVSDMLGQVVYEAKPNNTNTTLQLNNAGVYFITLTSGTAVKTQKIIITK